jgi:hypothetical protein
MLLEHDINRLLTDLLEKKRGEITLHGISLHLRLDEVSSCKFHVTTPVFHGDNYIPHSVRRGLKEVPQFAKQALHTDFLVDEERYLVILQHNDTLAGQTKQDLYGMLSDFCQLANDWIAYLDQQGKNDLIHVKAR